MCRRQVPPSWELQVKCWKSWKIIDFIVCKGCWMTISIMTERKTNFTGPPWMIMNSDSIWVSNKFRFGKYLQIGLWFWHVVFCVIFVSILSHFWPSFEQIYQMVVEILTENHSKKCMKIGHLRAIFSPWRRRVGKNLMGRTGKRIYRRFWISNQIFDSIYGSRDMALSLDTTFGIFGQNVNFVDEYLENG